MSERDVRRVEVVAEVLSGRRTVASAGIVLAVGVRQIHRLLIRFRENGGGALIHKSRGQPSNHSLSPGIREYALELVRTKYADFGPTLAIEVLLDKHAIRVGRETLRTWMIEDGLWLSRRQRKSSHQPRLRRESYGELIQIDGSDHRWLKTAAIRVRCWCSSTMQPANSCSCASWRVRARTPTLRHCKVIWKPMAARLPFIPINTRSFASTGQKLREARV